MSDLNKSSLSEIINLIKLKKISSLEITNHFIKNIEKSKNLNCFITTCFEKSIKSAKDFDAKKDFSGLLSGVPLAVKERLPSEIIAKLSHLKTLEDALLLLERFNKSMANKLFQNLSNTIEKRSFEYVNRYVKTDMQIAAIMFDRKRKTRWSGINGNDFISYFQ